MIRAMSIRKTLLSQISAYLDATGMSATAFSEESTGDHKFLARLRAGKGVTTTLIERAEAFISKNPPPKKKASA